ncbi:MAG: hypothetical protein J0H55_05095 [Chitinophagaceae bacterium]|nr:hypothetical protein [Chitinophagaceae bacterium]
MSQDAKTDTTFFELVGGSLEFQNTKLIITDKENAKRNLWIISAVCFVIISLAFIVSGRRDNDPLFFYLGITTVLVEALVIYRAFRKKRFARIDDRIFLNDIRGTSLKKSNNGETIAVRLFTNKKRERQFVIANEDGQYSKFKALLQKHQIEFTDSSLPA